MVCWLAACDRAGRTTAASEAHEREAASSPKASEAPTNRVDIPAAVRQNLGITFAKVESRKVSQTLRVPGRFELLPTARREYRAPLGGRIELLVGQYQPVEAGTPLYRIEGASWRDLHEQIVGTQAVVDSMGPLREAHRRHEASLADKVSLWEDRLKQLDELRSVGGGSASQWTEARATLNATQAELADVMEKDAELQAQQRQAEAQLRTLMSRRELLVRGSACAGLRSEGRDARLEDQASDAGLSSLAVCALAPGVVEVLGVTPGGVVEEHGHVLTVVQPEQIRFRARALQADLGRLRDGLPALIAPSLGGQIPQQDAMAGELRIGLSADADERTIDLLVVPTQRAPWARAGVSAQLEIELAGGTEELAIPMSAVVRDGTRAIIFRRDPKDADKVIRMEADLGLSDGRWVVIQSGVMEGDEIVLGGNFQLMLATSGTTEKAGHFHSDGTFHEGNH